MRQLVLAAPGRPEVRDVPAPEPAAREALVRVVSCGVCGSDLVRMREASEPVEHWGHELVGYVTAIGDRVDPALQGRAVAARTSVPCGACVRCMRGQPQCCASWSYHRFNGFSDYVALPAELLVVLPGPLEPAHVLVEPMYVALDLVARARLRPGERALVVGAGPLGLMALRRLRLSGIDLVFVVTRTGAGARAEQAARWGAACLDAAGLTQRAATLGCEAAIVTAPYGVLPCVVPALGFGGRIVYNGISGNSRVPLDLRELHTRRITLIPSFPHPQAGFAGALAALRDDAAELAQLITHRVPLAEAPDALAALADRSLDAVKLVFDVSGSDAILEHRRPGG